MDKYHSWKRTEDIELDLAELLRRLLRQWKQIAACALAFAVVLGGYSLVRSRGSAAEKEGPEGLDIKLTEEEQWGVTAAVELEAEVRGLEEYLNHSVLMQADPYHKNRAVLLYSIDHAKRQEVQKITESYLSYITDGGAADALKESSSGAWDMDKSYLSELVTAYQKAYSSPYQVAVDGTAEEGLQAESLFYVEITGKDAKMAAKLAKDTQSVLQGHYTAVKKAAGSHRLTLLSSGESIQADSSLQSQQHEKRAMLSSGLANLKTMTGAFSKEQMAAYQEATGTGTGDGPESQGEAGTGVASGVSMKYVFLGLAGGAFLYCGLFACLYLFSDKVKSVEEMKRLYTFPFYGCGQAEAQLVSRIKLACRKQGITRLCAASGFPLSGQEKGCMESIVKQLKSCGIDAVAVENACADASMWEAMPENVLMVCRIGTTTHRMVDEEMDFYLGNGIAVLGAMAFSQDKHKTGPVSES